MTDRCEKYVDSLSRMLQMETISDYGPYDKTKIYAFHNLLRELFPKLFSVCEFENYDGSFLLRWKGKTSEQPLMFMNHHDVVCADGAWSHPPFGGEIADGKLWGRGALDTKGGLFAMLQAAEELIEAGYVPAQDIYFESACTEECDGTGAKAISDVLEARKLRFYMILDEGGMIAYNPIGVCDCHFAMIGVGEKGCMDLKFIARSHGGHASSPPKNSPLVRLAKFVTAVERKRMFPAKMTPTVYEMFTRMGKHSSGLVGFVLSHARAFGWLLTPLLSMLSPDGAALLRTTMAFTMASGALNSNAMPQEASVVANMRVSHHQGQEDSLRRVQKLAERFDLTMEVTDYGFDPNVADYRGSAFRQVEAAVEKVFPGIPCAPYVTNSASDLRFMGKLSDQCIRFTPFIISDQQRESIHGIDENIDLSCLVPAVDFYKLLMRKE